MADWLVEEGIGEHRALLVDGGEAVAAKLDWPGGLAAGLVADAKLTHYVPARRRGTAQFSGGEEALVARLPADTREGTVMRLEVTRPALAERGRNKRAQARPSTSDPRPAPSLAEALGAKAVRALPAGLWEEVWSEAWSGEVAFPGGSLVVSPTPALTAIDIDGAAPAAQLAHEAVPAIAATLRRMDLGGSIAIDFPALADKADRRVVDELVAAALDGWPHERTAMNGFGLLHIVARLERPSLLHRLALNRAGAGARLLLRRAEQVAEPGQLLLTAHPAVLAQVGEPWLEELARRTGRQVRTAPDPALALDGGFAQAVAS
ncbi:ribonuclease [Altererythrobacter salegens]|uniref:Ribonuclease n=1 Tax=Croceibacterium salegens TaxID=1737568 RepID=A0A6I4SYM7_9SPHN|nr:ribonuclease E/G [Croceibacterium salegens]MXO60260.1 ribonuclease [Croceibacterium salegens]